MNLEAGALSDPSSTTSHQQKSLPSENSTEIAEPPISQIDSGNDAGGSLPSSLLPSAVDGEVKDFW